MAELDFAYSQPEMATSAKRIDGMNEERCQFQCDVFPIRLMACNTMKFPATVMLRTGFSRSLLHR